MMPKRAPKRSLQWVSIEKLTHPLSEEIAAITASIKRDLEKRYLGLRWQSPSQRPEIGNDNGAARPPGAMAPADHTVRVEAMPGAAREAPTPQGEGPMADAEREELIRAAVSSAAEAAALRRKLQAIQQQVAKISRAQQAGALRDLAETVREAGAPPLEAAPAGNWRARARIYTIAGLRRTLGQILAGPQLARRAAAVLAVALIVAVAALAAVSERLAGSAAAARVTESRLAELQAMHREVHGQAAVLRRDLAKAGQERLRLSAEVEAWQDKAARAEAALAAARTHLAANRQEVRAEAEAERQELINVARTASSDAVGLREDLAQARREIEDLRAAAALSQGEAARLAAQLAAAANKETAASARTSASAPPGVALARLASLSVAPAPGPERVTVNQLLARPAVYRDREVVVSGLLTRLLWNYRLRSDDGRRSLIVDAGQLSGEGRRRLEAVTQDLGALDSVAVHIVGRLRQEALSGYSLVASRLAPRD